MTTNRTAMIFCAGVAVLALSSNAHAQRWDGGPEPRVGACFYKDANFRGPYFCAEAGEDFDRMPSDANDEVSSIRIFGRAVVIAYTGRRFGGQAMRIDSNVRDLEREDFNDTISSFQIEGRRGQGGGRPDRPANPELIVRRAYQDILEREPDPAGMRVYRSHIIDDGWTEQQVREDLRNSREYREKNTMTRARAEAIVRQAYLAVLNREPDPASQGYVNNVLRNGWTQADVERELRRSPEYRGQARPR